MNSYTFTADVSLPCIDTLSPLMIQLMNLFGITCYQLEKTTRRRQVDFSLPDGGICYITGPSGSGKSTLLGDVYRRLPSQRRVSIHDIPLSDTQSVIDCMAVNGSVMQVTEYLSRFGLADAFALLRKPAALSEGQQYRYRLAYAVCCRHKFIFADEFCSSLDRVTAAALSFNIRKLADRTGCLFILAGAHSDIIPDLAPDILIVQHADRPPEINHTFRKKLCQPAQKESCRC